MSEKVSCPNCHAEFVPDRHRHLRWLVGGAGALIGGAATNSLLGGAIIGGLAYGLASVLDEYRARRCPECRTVAFESKSRRETTGRSEPVTVHSSH